MRFGKLSLLIQKQLSWNSKTFTTEEIKKKWLSAYCITIHKSQGDTYTDEYTIWDWGRISKRKDSQAKKLRYTAVSRSVNYNDLVKFK